MSDSIKLSPRYGVNPTIPICFWCGNPKNEVALMGKLGGRKEDLEAPKNVVLNYEPCNKCKELFSAGIHVIGVTPDKPHENMFPISKDDKTNTELYPTGAMFVAREEWVERVLEDTPEILEHVLEDRVLMLPTDVVDEIVKNVRAQDESEEEENENC